MGQEFVIKSQNLEDKINQLLPSQGGSAAGVDLSASTTIIPIVDLTESAEGSNLRQDLQTSFSFVSTNKFEVSNTTTTLVNTTGFYRVQGFFCQNTSTSTQGFFTLTDGVTTKDLFTVLNLGTVAQNLTTPYEFNVFLEAGHSLTATSTGTNMLITGSLRQIATIAKELVDP